MVIAVRKGASMREAAGLYHFGLATVHYWVRRAGNKPLSRLPHVQVTYVIPRELKEKCK